MYILVVKPSAEKDALEAANWYNEKVVGLGNEFLMALDAKINAIQRSPNHFQKEHKNIRRALIERFPYGIFFIVEELTIYILAIQHTSRYPGIWKKQK